MRTVLVRGARQLLTLRGPAGLRRGEALRDLGVIEDGSVLIEDGKIACVGPTRRVENLAAARNAIEINAAGKVVIPGFSDAHTQILAAPARVGRFRSEREAASGPGIRGDAALDAEFHYIRNSSAGALEHQGSRHIESFVRHGTTTLEVKTACGCSVGGEMKLLRVITMLADRPAGLVPTFLAGLYTHADGEGPGADYFSWLAGELLPRVRGRHMPGFLDVACDAGRFSRASAAICLAGARRFGIRVKVQADQSGEFGATAMAVENGAVSADGLNCISPAHVQLLARSDTVATLLPALVHQGTLERFPPARALIDAGAGVALASGFHPSFSSTFNMQMVISLACSHLKLTAEEAISAATVNGAWALGRGEERGSLEYGKAADLLILNLSDYRELPLYFGVNAVQKVLRGGRIVFGGEEAACVGA